jgi:hypothetical protein
VGTLHCFGLRDPINFALASVHLYLLLAFWRYIAD